MGAVSVAELADAFGVSHETIRRDLKVLADQGHLDVVHGGASRRGMMEPALAQRTTENIEGKTAIARKAVTLVPESGSVLLDSGSTTAAIALELARRYGLTICTNSLSHAALLCRVPGNHVYVLGGQVDSNDEATFGIGALSSIDSVRVDVAFIGAGGFAEDGILTDYTLVAAELRGRMILTGRTYVVADYEKFTRRTPFRVPHFQKAAGIITDRPAGRDLSRTWDAYGLEVHVAN
jgi:DeoR/GlpR family transcriptional regulator of sugar metabolism